MRASVLVLSSEPAAERMAGPAVRAVELARALCAEHDVTLAAPAPSRAPDERIALIEAGFEDFDTLLAAARGHDVVVAQELPPTLLGRLAGLSTRVVLDLYNPIVMEVLEAVAARPPRAQKRIQKLITSRALAQIAVADFIVCASERQRDLWLGGMALLGLIDLDAYRQDPALRTLIDVVPFGIPAEPPAGAERSPLRAAFPAIAAGDRVLLWAGGIWGWLDPETPIRAAAALERTHLVFMGTGRPGLERTGQAPFVERAVELARREGLEGERVHFNAGWVPYAERGAWLLDADLGVTAHLDHLEARFSFRTRVLDYIWAGLPVVGTRGDALAELVERENLGRTVEPGDVEGFAAACRELLDDEHARAAVCARIASVAPSLRWDVAARPLVDWCARQRELPGRRPRSDVLRRAARAQYLRILSNTVDERGVRAGAAQVLRRLRRAIGRH
ncbi:MAG: glycosyltransferase [Thermoleophilaceae bacterium]